MWEGLASESAATFKYNCLESGKSFDEALLNQVSLDCQFRTTCCRVHYPCNTVYTSDCQTYRAVVADHHGNITMSTG